MIIKYRPDIDGLRALAVVPIVLFHAGVSGFSGGFVGVDIFFVISGFLITSGVIKQVEEETFSIASFYDRRARRIFPALACMLLITAVFGLIILLPSELRDLPKAVAGSALFVSNVVFWRDASYFDATSEFNPLLHTWSLGIEEQFYIFSPLFFAACLRYLKSGSVYAVALAAAVSLALCVALTPSVPGASFYLIPTRAWELLAGSLVAFRACPEVNRPWLRETLSLSGVMLVAFSIVSFDQNTQFPGYHAALPVFGTVLAIAYGVGTKTAKMLSTKSIVFIGAISYSLYLYHWPIMVYARDLGLLNESFVSQCLVVIASGIPAYISWRYVETPFRDRNWLSRRRVFKLSAAAGLCLLGLAGSISALDGLPNRFSKMSLAYEAGEKDFSPLRTECHVDSGLPLIGRSCLMGGNGHAKTAVWGDSHGVELAYALASSDLGIRQITYSACPPALGYISHRRPDCLQHNRDVARFLRDKTGIDTVILTAYFDNYLDEMDFDLGIIKTTRYLLSIGKTVVVVGPTPGEGVSYLPKHLARGGRDFIPQILYENRERRSLALLDSLHGLGAKVVLPEKTFCSDGICHSTVNGKPIFFDDHHLSVAGANALAPAIALSIRP